jgi:hypothetical protein
LVEDNHGRQRRRERRRQLLVRLARFLALLVLGLMNRKPTRKVNEKNEGESTRMLSPCKKMKISSHSAPERVQWLKMWKMPC